MARKNSIVGEARINAITLKKLRKEIGCSAGQFGMMCGATSCDVIGREHLRVEWTTKQIAKIRIGLGLLQSKITIGLKQLR